MSGRTEPDAAEPADPVEPSAAGPSGADDGPPWQRLDLRTILGSVIVTAVSLLGLGILTAVILLIVGIGPGWILLWVSLGVVGGTAAVALAEWLRWRATGYRIDDLRIERRVQFLGSWRTSLSRDRIRNVELSADLFQRALGITEVKLATAEGEGERFALQALDRAVAEQLRAELLGERADAEAGALAAIDWRWLRYAPVSLATGAIGLAVYGAVFQVAGWFGAVPALVTWILTTTETLPLLVLIPAVLLGALLIGTVATTAAYVEGWWGYRLGRHADGSLDLRRGLLISRSTVFDGDRLRGVTLHEPLGLRQVSGARLDVVAVGVRAAEANEQNAQSPALVPPSPREVSAQVAEAVLGAPLATSLRAHPVAARRRRLVRAAAGTLAATGAAAIPLLWWPGLWWVPPVTLVVVGLLAVVLALDNARGLGHQITGTHVHLRKGSLFRRTDVLTRDGLIGWNLTRTPFQRRAGLGTVVATSAAGSGAYRLPDVDAAQATELMGTAGGVWEHLRVKVEDSAPG